MGVDDYCVPDLNATELAAGGEQSYTCRAPHELWVASCYWAVMSITSIGYGDITATAGNTSEQAVATVLMILGAMVWGLVLGNHSATAISARVRTRARLPADRSIAWLRRDDRLQPVQPRP